MSEGWTIAQAAEHDRWCRGKHLDGDPVWWPRRDECKRRGVEKIGGNWYCKRHLRECKSCRLPLYAVEQIGHEQECIHNATPRDARCRTLADAKRAAERLVLAARESEGTR